MKGLFSMPAFNRFASIPALLALACSAAIVPALADNGPLYVAPGPTTIIPADAIKRYQEQSVGSRKLGDLIGNSLKSSTSHATDLLVTTKCGHYQMATITFADGSIKTLNLSNAAASQTDMEQAKSAIPILHFVDMVGCDG
jgi:hypothetical protein